MLDLSGIGCQAVQVEVNESNEELEEYDQDDPAAETESSNAADGSAMELDPAYGDQQTQDWAYIKHFGGHAGEINHAHGIQAGYHDYSAWIAMQAEVDQWMLFTLQMDWEVVRWAKLRGPSSMAFSELLAIPGVG